MRPAACGSLRIRVSKPYFQSIPSAATTARVAAAIVLTTVCLRSAWVCDDAFITMRTVDNLVQGHGLRWNVAERVQTFTHPLWTFLLVPFYLVTREAYYTVVAVSLVLTAALAFGLTLRGGSSTAGVLTAATMLISSKAFVDFSTSGLENPLAHLLLALFVVLCMPRENKPKRLELLSAVAGLLVLTRMDTLLLVLPALISVMRGQSRRRVLVALSMGFAPFLAWELFALVYYGAPFPNTAYAKLGTGIPRAELVGQGLAYVTNSLRIDPVTLPAVVVAAGLAVWRRKRIARALAVGAFLYIVYVIWIGGDFMSGRFFAAPLVLSVTLLARCFPPIPAAAALSAPALILLVGILPATAPLRSGADYAERHRATAADSARITDERAFYYAETGLLGARRGAAMPDHPSAHEGRAARASGPGLAVRGGVGFFGYYAGPDWTIVEKWAVCDPLLARLPVPEGAFWRIGHFTRPLPSGYPASLRDDVNLITDPRVAELYDAVREVTRGPLFSRRRAVAVWRLNTGAFAVPRAYDYSTVSP